VAWLFQSRSHHQRAWTPGGETPPIQTTGASSSPVPLFTSFGFHCLTTTSPPALPSSQLTRCKIGTSFSQQGGTFLRGGPFLLQRKPWEADFPFFRPADPVLLWPREQRVSLTGPGPNTFEVEKQLFGTLLTQQGRGSIMPVYTKGRVGFYPPPPSSLVFVEKTNWEVNRCPS